jgi:hypothetical protein
MKKAPHVGERWGARVMGHDRCENGHARAKLIAGAPRRNRGGYEMSFRKTCAWCAATFRTDYRQKLCCSFECAKKYDTMRQREREQRRQRQAAAKKAETRETRGLGDPLEQA